MENSELRRSAKISLKGFWLKNIILALIYGVITYGFDSIFREQIEKSDFWLLLSWIYLIFIGIPIATLISIFFLQLSRTQIWKLDHFKESFNKIGYGSLVITGFLQMLFISLWTFLLIIPGIIKTYSYSMTFYILYDNPHLSANQAITASREMMDGYKGKLFLLDLYFVLLYILSIVTLFIGSLWIYQYHVTSRVKFYESIKFSVES